AIKNGAVVAPISDSGSLVRFVPANPGNGAPQRFRMDAEGGSEWPRVPPAVNPDRVQAVNPDRVRPSPAPPTEGDRAAGHVPRTAGRARAEHARVRPGPARPRRAAPRRR